MYDVPFGGDFRGAAELVAAIITHILQSQASVLTPQVEDEEGTKCQQI